MIPRLKRQTKKRHSARRRWPGEPFGMRPINRVKWDRFLEREIRARGTFTIEMRPIEPIVGAQLTPDVWAP